MLLRQAAHFAVISTRSRLHYSSVGQIWYLTDLSSSRKEGLKLVFSFDCHGDHHGDAWRLESVVIIFYFQFSLLNGRDRRARIQHLDGTRTEPAKPLVLSALRCSPRSISDSCNTWSASSLFSSLCDRHGLERCRFDVRECTGRLLQTACLPCHISH